MLKIFSGVDFIPLTFSLGVRTEMTAEFAAIVIISIIKNYYH